MSVQKYVDAIIARVNVAELGALERPEADCDDVCSFMDTLHCDGELDDLKTAIVQVLEEDDKGEDYDLMDQIEPLVWAKIWE